MAAMKPKNDGIYLNWNTQDGSRRGFLYLLVAGAVWSLDLEGNSFCLTDESELNPSSSPLENWDVLCNSIPNPLQQGLRATSHEETAERIRAATANGETTIMVEQVAA